MSKAKRKGNVIYSDRFLDYMDSFIPKDKLQQANDYQKKRNELLKKHPKYVSIVKRLDEPIIQGNIEETVERYLKHDCSPNQFKEAINSILEYVDINRDIKYRDKELFVNISPDVMKLLIGMCNIIELENVDLSIYKYHGFYMCEAPELNGYQFNVYTLKEDTDKKETNTDKEKE